MQTLDQFIQDFRTNFRSTGLPNQVAQVIDENLAHVEVFVVERLRVFLQTLPEMLASLSLFILSPVLAIYFLADWKRLNKGCLRLVPQKWRVEWQRLLQDINHVVRRFIRGDLIVAVVVGILTGIGVKLVGMDYALLIGIICGVFDLIPYFGPVIGAVPSILLGLTHSPIMGLKIAIVIIVVQQLESDVISPKLMGDSVGLHPLLIVFVLLAGGELAGFWGMLFSVPIAAVLRVILRHIYFRLVAPDLSSDTDELELMTSVDK
jgi:predicted PurR-regulated permease PerM